MNNDVDWESLARYLAGECSEEEHERILARAEKDPGFRAVLESARRTWGASGLAARRWDAKAAWGSVQPRLQGAAGGQGASGPVSLSARRKAPRHGIWRGRPAMAAGLATLLAATAVVAVLRWRAGAGAVAVAQEFSTPNGSRATVRLPDGSSVTLAPASRLTPSPDFGGSRREVELVGEALFQVSHDPTRPFIVRSGSTVTRVLGTVFDVRAYPDGEAVRVVVQQGRVSFRVRHAPDAAAQLLLPGELGEVAPGSSTITRRKVDLAAYLGWRQGTLNFDNAPLSEVVAQLVRWYGVQVRIGDPALRSRRLTASFHGQSLDEVTAVVAASLGLDCVRTGDVRTFVPKGSVAGREPVVRALS